MATILNIIVFVVVLTASFYGGPDVGRNSATAAPAVFGAETGGRSRSANRMSSGRFKIDRTIDISASTVAGVDEVTEPSTAGSTASISTSTAGSTASSPTSTADSTTVGTGTASSATVTAATASIASVAPADGAVGTTATRVATVATDGKEPIRKARREKLSANRRRELLSAIKRELLRSEGEEKIGISNVTKPSSNENLLERLETSSEGDTIGVDVDALSHVDEGAVDETTSAGDASPEAKRGAEANLDDEWIDLDREFAGDRATAPSRRKRPSAAGPASVSKLRLKPKTASVETAATKKRAGVKKKKLTKNKIFPAAAAASSQPQPRRDETMQPTVDHDLSSAAGAPSAATSAGADRSTSKGSASFGDGAGASSSSIPSPGGVVGPNYAAISNYPTSSSSLSSSSSYYSGLYSPSSAYLQSVPLLSAGAVQSLLPSSSSASMGSVGQYLYVIDPSKLFPQSAAAVAAVVPGAVTTNGGTSATVDVDSQLSQLLLQQMLTQQQQQQQQPQSQLNAMLTSSPAAAASLWNVDAGSVAASAGNYDQPLQLQGVKSSSSSGYPSSIASAQLQQLPTADTSAAAVGLVPPISTSDGVGGLGVETELTTATSSTNNEQESLRLKAALSELAQMKQLNSDLAALMRSKQESIRRPRDDDPEVDVGGTSKSQSGEEVSADKGHVSVLEDRSHSIDLSESRQPALGADRYRQNATMPQSAKTPVVGRPAPEISSKIDDEEESSRSSTKEKGVKQSGTLSEQSRTLSRLEEKESPRFRDESRDDLPPNVGETDTRHRTVVAASSDDGERRLNRNRSDNLVRYDVVPSAETDSSPSDSIVYYTVIAIFSYCVTHNSRTLGASQRLIESSKLYSS